MKKGSKKSENKGTTDVQTTVPASVSDIVSVVPTFRKSRIPKDVSIVLLAGIVFAILFYLVHCIYMAADLFSSPTIVMRSRGAYGQSYVIDDYREAYSWLRENAGENAKIGSWWGTSFLIHVFL